MFHNDSCRREKTLVAAILATIRENASPDDIFPAETLLRWAAIEAQKSEAEYLMEETETLLSEEQEREEFHSYPPISYDPSQEWRNA